MVMQLLHPARTATAHPRTILNTARRKALRLAAVAAVATAAAAAAPAALAEYPERPIQLVLSFPPAGATDVLARAVGQRLSQQLQQPVVVENRPGAGGAIGLAYAAKAAPDGYTLYLAAVSNAAIAAATYSSQPADLARDFVPIAGIGNVPHILVVPATLPVKTVPDLVRYLQGAPGRYNFASQGNGTLSHLESELFRLRTGVDVVHVPYKGSSFALPDLMAGRSAMMFDSIPAALPHVKSGKLRLLAVASERRVGSLPEAPTMAEAGIRDFGVNNLFGLVAPKGTPPAVVQKLAAATRAALAMPDLVQSLEAQGVQLQFTPSDAFARMIGEEMRTWSKVAQAAKVRID
ncbi:tripartite tricarboxylate transporter substrate binding protein [Cupriavidus gilardii]|uniref:Tripartite tricarboxylate transporter substrate binding protein n=2 Tax=Cupriavidus gilardii TaxID=82541 RepID=A0A6N1BI29_9BURK|nr:tripartite tricarboxylate transporter substrate binding protein [Cupriavidus gilardii]NNH10643.1 tripartite tricarboxylate transporter substrate binding protein [Cupriavidus gilardii]QKS61164.1 tripartite tricarboxylate transporter substrate binding protein [Cupriavidus gilardii]